MEQWERFCLRRHIQTEGCSILSAQKLKTEIRSAIEKTKDLELLTEKYFNQGAIDNKARVTIIEQGPALTVMAKVEETHRFSKKEDYTYFYADFTLGLHCLEWPEDGKGR